LSATTLPSRFIPCSPLTRHAAEVVSRPTVSLLATLEGYRRRAQPLRRRGNGEVTSVYAPC